MMTTRAATAAMRAVAQAAASEARRRAPQIRESIQSLLADEERRNKAARTIQKSLMAFKKRKGVKHRLAPEAVTSTRQRGKLLDSEAISMRSQLISLLDYPEAGSGVGQRLGSTITLAGLKVCEQFHNDQAYPIVVHWALLQQRRNKASNLENFFRDTTSATDRSLNFSNASAGGSQAYSFAYDCYPINPDEFNILDHRKKVLSAENTDLHWTYDTWKFEKYYKIDTKFTFDNSTDTQPQKPIIRVIWWQPLRSNDWVTPLSNPLPTITRSSKSVCYFRPNFV